MDEEERKVFVQIAARLERLQRERNISITDLARSSKIDETELESIFRGEVDLQIHTVYVLAGALRVKPALVLQGIEWMPGGASGGHFRIEDPEEG